MQSKSIGKYTRETVHVYVRSKVYLLLLSNKVERHKIFELVCNPCTGHAMRFEVQMYACEVKSTDCCFQIKFELVCNPCTGHTI